MAPKYDDDDDWSDEDEDEVSDVETSVQLGIPDGPLDSAADRVDAAVSRIGGLPVRYILFPIHVPSSSLNAILSTFLRTHPTIMISFSNATSVCRHS